MEGKRNRKWRVVLSLDWHCWVIWHDSLLSEGRLLSQECIYTRAHLENTLKAGALLSTVPLTCVKVPHSLLVPTLSSAPKLSALPSTSFSWFCLSFQVTL